MSEVTTVAFIWRVFKSTINAAVPVASVVTAGTSSLPVSVAENILSGTVLLRVLTRLMPEVVALVGLLSLPHAASSKASNATHHVVNSRVDTGFMSDPLVEKYSLFCWIAALLNFDRKVTNSLR